MPWHSPGSGRAQPEGQVRSKRLPQQSESRNATKSGLELGHPAYGEITAVSETVFFRRTR